MLQFKNTGSPFIEVLAVFVCLRGKLVDKLLFIFCGNLNPIEDTQKKPNIG
jgi:hypothetical protein